VTDNDAHSKFDTLTNREKEVLNLVCEGLIYKEVGAELFIAEATVKSHMGNIYRKLSLDELPNTQRTGQLFKIYCQMLKERPPSSNNDEEEEEEPEPVPPEVERMVEEDEKALVLRQSPQIIDVSPKPAPKRKSRGSLWLFIGGIIVGIAILLGLLYVFREPIIALIAPGEPTTQEVAQKPSNTQKSVPSSTPEVNEVLIVVTATSPPSTNTPAPTNTSPPPTDTAVPTPFVPDNYYEIGEWYETDQVGIRLLESDIEYGMLYFIVEFWNKTDQTLYFSWTPSTQIFLIDNLGRRYNTTWSVTENSEVAPGDNIILNSRHGRAASFSDDFMYETDVTDMYLLMENISRVEEVYFHVEIGK
jgi:hypothetical protein